MDFHCAYCRGKGKLHLAGSPPPSVPRTGPMRDECPCPHCFPEAWAAAEKKAETGPAAQCGE